MKKAIVLVILISAFLFAGVFNANAQSHKTHIVEEGQTLYSISKAYGVTVSDLLKSNPQIEDNIIQFGQEVIIPNIQKTSTKPSTSTNSPSNQGISNQPFTTPASSKKVVESAPVSPPSPATPIRNHQFATISHIVKGKETLYAISKEYGVTVDQIKAWNHLEGNDIKIGSVIVIRTEAKEVPATVPPREEVPQVPVKAVEKMEPEIKEQKEVVKATSITLDDVVRTEEVLTKVNRANPQDQLSREFVSAQNSGRQLQTARGTISWINTENAQMSDSYFALHKTQPVGTIVKVTNLVNKRVVFVKVIGKLPQTSENINVTLRLSSAAKNALLLNGDKAYVNMDYYQ